MIGVTNANYDEPAPQDKPPRSRVGVSPASEAASSPQVILTLGPEDFIQAESRQDAAYWQPGRRDYRGRRALKMTRFG